MLLMSVLAYMIMQMVLMIMRMIIRMTTACHMINHDYYLLAPTGALYAIVHLYRYSYTSLQYNQLFKIFTRPNTYVTILAPNPHNMTNASTLGSLRD